MQIEKKAEALHWTRTVFVCLSVRLCLDPSESLLSIHRLSKCMSNRLQYVFLSVCSSVYLSPLPSSANSSRGLSRGMTKNQTGVSASCHKLSAISLFFFPPSSIVSAASASVAKHSHRLKWLWSGIEERRRATPWAEMEWLALASMAVKCQRLLFS